MNREQMVEKAALALAGQDYWSETDLLSISFWGGQSVRDGLREQAIQVLDAILPQVTNSTELSALPSGSIVTDGTFICQSMTQFADEPPVWFQFHGGRWRGSGALRSKGVMPASGEPLTVIFQPEVRA